MNKKRLLPKGSNLLCLFNDTLTVCKRAGGHIGLENFVEVVGV
jgi:hypothetical protein